MAESNVFAPDPLNLGMFKKLDGLKEWIEDYNELVCEWCGGLYRERQDNLNCPNCGGTRKRADNGGHKSNP